MTGNLIAAIWMVGIPAAASGIKKYFHERKGG